MILLPTINRPEPAARTYPPCGATKSSFPGMLIREPKCGETGITSWGRVVRRTRVCAGGQESLYHFLSGVMAEAPVPTPRPPARCIRPSTARAWSAARVEGCRPARRLATIPPNPGPSTPLSGTRPPVSTPPTAPRSKPVPIPAPTCCASSTRTTTSMIATAPPQTTARNQSHSLWLPAATECSSHAPSAQG